MNRYGFGLLAFLGFLTFLGVCILTSAIYYQDLTNTNMISSSNNSVLYKEAPYRMSNDYSGVTYPYSDDYYALENVLKKSAMTYVSNYSIQGDYKMIITLQTLKNKNIIENIYDSKQQPCNGYVIYDAVNNIYKPYLKCNYYKSVDYLNYLE